MPRQLVWSEIRDLLDLTGCADVPDLLAAIANYRDDPPHPNEIVGN
ncbi:hypothetical protein JOF34_002516 [Microbacterium amylolyticum]|uniref:Uncharacterized protein n=1 Tax=Microbacterium amylolyticum TaxID=936337 RepID=A0ABS4ZKQ3_9MICO|nr:hypothetical protein [Microbacterium amylolyticum]